MNADFYVDILQNYKQEITNFLEQLALSAR